MSEVFFTTKKKSFNLHKNKDHNAQKNSNTNISSQGILCVTCGKQYNQQDELNTHIKNEHPKSQEAKSDC